MPILEPVSAHPYQIYLHKDKVQGITRIYAPGTQYSTVFLASSRAQLHESYRLQNKYIAATLAHTQDPSLVPLYHNSPGQILSYCITMLSTIASWLGVTEDTAECQSRVLACPARQSGRLQEVEEAWQRRHSWGAEKVSNLLQDMSG